MRRGEFVLDLIFFCFREVGEDMIGRRFKVFLFSRSGGG